MGRSDAEKEKTKKLLRDWGKRPQNRLCADCSMKQPGWASTNIGVIVCIHCSGIHRKMGVHISFVKSLTLDSWQPKLAKSFIAQGGNLHINSMYEANLPKGVKPTDPTDMRKLETFIRAKYEQKKWFSAKGKKKKKSRKKEEVSDSDSDSDDSSDSDSSEPKKKQPTKKVKGDRLRKSQRKKRRPRPAPAKKEKPTKKKDPALNPPVNVATPADDVPDLLDFGAMKLETTEPPKNDDFNLFSDFSPKGSTSPPSFIPGMADQTAAPQPTQNAIDPFQQPMQPANSGAQSATDKVMNLFKQTQQPQHNHNANIFTQISGPSPGFGSNFQQQGMQQRPVQGGFQQQRPMQGFQQQRSPPMQMQGFQQQPMGFQQQRPMQGFQHQMGGFGRGFQQQPQQMGFGVPRQNQMGFQQQPMSSFGSAPQQQPNAFAGFGNVQQQKNNGGFGFI